MAVALESTTLKEWYSPSGVANSARISSATVLTVKTYGEPFTILNRFDELNFFKTSPRPPPLGAFRITKFQRNGGGGGCSSSLTPLESLRFSLSVKAVSINIR